MALRTRLALLVALAVAALVAAGGALFVSQLRRGLDASLDASLRARADVVVQQVGPDGSTGFQDSGAGALLPPGEALAQVVDARGRLLESSEGTRGRALLSAAQLGRARRGPVTATSPTPFPGGLRLFALPVPDSGRTPMVVVVATTRALSDEALHRVQAGLVVGGLLAVALSGVGAWLLAGAALRPVERMRQQAAEISAVNGAARLAVPATHDELARLGATMNALLGRLQGALVRQRNFVADAGHELRTPLTILRAELELATRPGRGYQELTAAVERAAEETDRLIRLAEDLLVLARADDGEAAFLRLAPIRFDTVVDEAVLAAEAQAGAAGVKLSLDGLSPVVLDADCDRLRQVIDNLLSNALRYAPRGSTITLRLLAAGASPATVALEVLDDGPGFPAGFLPHAFERFRRVDPARAPNAGGAGLGLAIVASLIGAHGGTVTAENRTGGGACVRVELPTAALAS